MEPQILCKPAFRVVGISLEVEKNKDGLESLWENLAARYKEIPHADPDQGFGVHTFPAGEHQYFERICHFASYFYAIISP